MTKKGKKLKFVFVTEYFPSKDTIDVQGGVEIRTYYLAKVLAKKYSVTVIASKEKNKPNKQILSNVLVKRVGINSTYRQKGKFIERISFLFQAILECLTLDIDLLEGTGFLGQIVVLFVSKIKKVSTVAFVPDIFSDFSSYFGFFNNFIIRGIERIIFSHKWDGYIAISNDVYRKITKFKVSPNKIKVIYCGIDVNKIKKIKKQRTKYPSICSISRLVTYKGINYILKSLSLLTKTYPKIKYFIIGDGEEYGSLKSLVNKLGINKNVIFYRFIPNHNKVLEILSTSWIYCSASRVEGFGIATIEAMVAKVPFVIADIPINREITKKKGGLFFKPKNISDLKEKLEKLLKDKYLLERITKKNQETTSYYDINYMVKATQSYYLELLNS